MGEVRGERELAGIAAGFLATASGLGDWGWAQPTAAQRRYSRSESLPVPQSSWRAAGGGPPYMDPPRKTALANSGVSPLNMARKFGSPAKPMIRPLPTRSVQR